MNVKERNEINQQIIQSANQIAKDIDKYNVRVLIAFLKDELNRNYDEIKLIKKEQFRIQMMISKLKRDIFKEVILLDVEELNKTF